MFSSRQQTGLFQQVRHVLGRKHRLHHRNGFLCFQQGRQAAARHRHAGVFPECRLHRGNNGYISRFENLGVQAGFPDKLPGRGCFGRA